MTNEELKEVRKRIEAMAKLRGVRILDIPGKMGFSYNTYIDRVNGKTEWKLSEIVRLAAVLETFPVKLFPMLGGVQK